MCFVGSWALSYLRSELLINLNLIDLKFKLFFEAKGNNLQSLWRLCVWANESKMTQLQWKLRQDLLQLWTLCVGGSHPWSSHLCGRCYAEVRQVWEQFYISSQPLVCAFSTSEKELRLEGDRRVPLGNPRMPTTVLPFRGYGSTMCHRRWSTWGL